MKNKSILIFEDDLLIANRIESYLLQIGLNDIYQIQNYECGMQFLKQKVPDIVLLNICSKRGALAVAFAAQLRSLNPNTILILLAEKIDKCIVEQFKYLRPSGYIPKPVRLNALMVMLEFSCLKVLDHESVLKRENSTYLKDNGIIHRIILSRIKYIETKHVYSYLYIDGDHKAKMFRLSMKELMGHLPVEDFVQTHRSFAVNLKYSDQVSKNGVKVEDQLIPISRSRYSTIKSAFQNYQ